MFGFGTDSYLFLSNVAEWFLVDEFRLIDRRAEVVYDGGLWWISNYVVRHVRTDLVLQSSFASYCPKVLRTHPICLSIVAAPRKSGHLLNRTLILGCDPDTWRFKRVLGHLLKLFVATVRSGHYRCHIYRLPLTDWVIVITPDYWKVFISGVPSR